MIQKGKDLAILSIGHPGNFVINAQKKLKEVGLVLRTTT